VEQSAYEIVVSDDKGTLVWDSGKHRSWASVGVPYAGKPLKAAATYHWKVRVWDKQGRPSPWSATASWQMGLPDRADWKGAAWIGYARLPDTPFGDNIPNDILPQFQKGIAVRGALRRATAFVCGLGQFEVSLNGQKVGDHYLDPGWTRYDKEALYVPLDITGALHAGDNKLTIALGNGFLYTPSARYLKLQTTYAYPKLIARIHLEYADGREADVVTDPSWAVAPSPTVFSSIYGGEDYDARLEAAPRWKPAVLVASVPVLRPQEESPLKVVEAFEPRSLTQVGPGAWTYDLGQNMSGIPEITVRGRRGDTVRIYPGELVKSDGRPNQDATGSPYFFTYILKGDSTETWRPKFSYYGFRYLLVEGAVPQGRDNAGGWPVVERIRGLHTRNAADSVGTFTCSNELFNRINTLIRWSIQNNMASVLTDCPHREKLGWLEQTHLMGNSNQYNYDLSTLYRKTVHDMITSQLPSGLVPEIAPEFTVFSEPFRDSPEWGSACLILPWDLYCWYGDEDIIRESYPMMQRYMAYLGTRADHNILMQGLGDWFDLGPSAPGESQLTPRGLTPTAFYYSDACLLAKVSGLLGHPLEARHYDSLAVRIREAFNARFFHPDIAIYGSGSQTANAMAVYMGLVDPQRKREVVNRIVDDIRVRHNSLTAGDIGYHYLVKVLAEEGRGDLLYEMNNQSATPGYGYQLAKGATALTESWQALPDVSNDHLMLGHLMEWFYEEVAGIAQQPGSVAYHRILLQPTPVGDLRSAEARYRSAYGLITSAWSLEGADFVLRAHIPANTRALVSLPMGEAPQKAASVEGGAVSRFEGGRAFVDIGSGDYVFRVRGYAPSSPAQRVAVTAMTLWKDSMTVGKPLHWNYEQGVVLAGMQALWERTGDSTYLTYIRHTIEPYMEADGGIRSYKPEEFSLDNINTGRALLFLSAATGDKRYRRAADGLRDQLRKQPRNKDGGFWHKKIYPDQMWLDGLYMAEPFYVRYALAAGEDTDYADIARQFVLMEARVRDPATGLLYHGWDASFQERWVDPATGHSPNAWARAMGWYGAALVDVLDVMPANRPERKVLTDILRRLAEAIVRVQDKDSGLWWDVLNEPGHPGNYMEASASCLFVYTLAKGVRLGLLPPDDTTAADKGFAGILRNFVTADGHVDGTVHASGLGGTPYRDGSYDYYVGEYVDRDDPKGIGAFLLAASEIR
jgi:rhamnogalacturonyl hydrolase YesR